MSLTDTQIKNAKCPADKKQIKLFDRDGLYLLVTSTGSKTRAKRISAVCNPVFGSDSSTLISQPAKRVFFHSISAGRTRCE